MLCAAVLARERARALALSRGVGEQAHAAADQVGAPARRLVASSRRSRRRSSPTANARRPRRARRARGGDRAPSFTLQRSAPSTARPTSSAAKLDCESVSTSPPNRNASTSEAHATCARARGASSIHGDEQHHHDRQEAPVDVRVEEQRVDAEVVLELVGGDDLRVEEQVARRVLDEADRRERHGEPGRAPPGSGRPAAWSTCRRREQHEQHGERDVEEDDVLERAAGVGRVGRLHRVEDERRGQRPLQAARLLRRVLDAPADPRRRPRQRAGRDDEVERQQQVRGRAADRDRDAERDASRPPRSGTPTGCARTAPRARRPAAARRRRAAAGDRAGRAARRPGWRPRRARQDHGRDDERAAAAARRARSSRARRWRRRRAREQAISGRAVAMSAPSGPGRRGRTAGGRPARAGRSGSRGPSRRAAPTITARPSGVTAEATSFAAPGDVVSSTAWKPLNSPPVPWNRPMSSLALVRSNAAGAERGKRAAEEVGGRRRRRVDQPRKPVSRAWRSSDPVPIETSVPPADDESPQLRLKRRAGARRASPARSTPECPASFGPAPSASATSVVTS